MDCMLGWDICIYGTYVVCTLIGYHLFILLQELIQAGPHRISSAVAQLLEGVEQKKKDSLGRSLSMARLSSRNSQGLVLPCTESLPAGFQHIILYCIHPIPDQPREDWCSARMSMALPVFTCHSTFWCS